MASKITDLIFTYSFLKRLVTPFNETRAYELGIIDERGKKIIDFKENNLHVVGYSKKIDKKISFKQLL